MHTELFTQIFEDLKRHEADKPYAYDDATGKKLEQGDTLRGNLTIGIGWNLSDRNLPDHIRYELADIAIEQAVNDCEKTFGAFHTFPDQVKRVFINMMFNMGIRRFRNFHHMIAAADARDWSEVANQMVDSVWYTQVGERSRELELIMRSVSEV